MSRNSVGVKLTYMVLLSGDCWDVTDIQGLLMVSLTLQLGFGRRSCFCC